MVLLLSNTAQASNLWSDYKKQEQQRLEQAGEILYLEAVEESIEPKYVESRILSQIGLLKKRLERSPKNLDIPPRLKMLEHALAKVQHDNAPTIQPSGGEPGETAPEYPSFSD